MKVQICLNKWLVLWLIWKTSSLRHSFSTWVVGNKNSADRFEEKNNQRAKAEFQKPKRCNFFIFLYNLYILFFFFSFFVLKRCLSCFFNPTNQKKGRCKIIINNNKTLFYIYIQFEKNTFRLKENIVTNILAFSFFSLQSSYFCFPFQECSCDSHNNIHGILLCYLQKDIDTSHMLSSVALFD